MAVGLLPVDQKTLNGKELGGRWHWETPLPSGYPHTHRTAFPTVGGSGVLGAGGDADDNEGTISTEVFPGYCDYTGGGQPPPPPVRYYSALEVPKQVARQNHPVCHGGGSKEMTIGGRGDEGDSGEGLSG